MTRGIDFGDFIYWAATSNHYRQLKIAAGHKSVKIGNQGEHLADENEVGVVPPKSGHGHPPPPLLSAEYQLGYRSCNCTVLDSFKVGEIQTASRKPWLSSLASPWNRKCREVLGPRSMEPLDAPGSFNLGSLLVSLLLFFSSRLPYSLPCSHFPVMLVPKGNIHRFPLILREDT